MKDLTYKLQGDPPDWYTEALWYYENIHQEQWIAIVQDNHVIFSGLDIGWDEIKLTPKQAEEAYKIIIGEKKQDEKFSDNPLSNWILNTGELLWIASVLNVAVDTFALNKLY